jgi:ribosomal protein L3 glutamine methyltransferase
MSLIELIEKFSLQLQEAGISTGQGTFNTFDEAAWLVLWRLGLPLDSDLEELSSVAPYATLTPQNVESLNALIEERIQSRKPSAYLTNEAWLGGLSFYVDERVIIPRSHIAEILLNETLKPWMSNDPKQILDLCTGNGSLAIICALLWPESHIDGLDISTDALDVAQINSERHKVQPQIDWITSNALHAAKGPYDLIVCNPPYVPQSSMENLPAEFKSEPTLALAGGQNGMDFISETLPKMHHFMKPNSLLVLEIGHEIQAFSDLYPKLKWITLSTQAYDDQVLLITYKDLSAHFN